MARSASDARAPRRRRSGGPGRAKPPVAAGPFELVDLEGPDRERALPILRESFTGYYRWHAKRTLGEIERARAAVDGPTLLGVSLLERLRPGVGYVYYIFVGARFRRSGVGRQLLADALGWFRSQGCGVVFAAVEESNAPSIRLFQEAGFREVARDEVGWENGGLGAQGLRSRMYVVAGETVFGLRLRPAPIPHRIRPPSSDAVARS